MQGWQASLVEKAALEAQAKAAALDAAKADLEMHALERAAKKEAKMSRNREQEQARKLRCIDNKCVHLGRCVEKSVLFLIYFLGCVFL